MAPASRALDSGRLCPPRSSSGALGAVVSSGYLLRFLLARPSIARMLDLLSLTANPWFSVGRPTYWKSAWLGGHRIFFRLNTSPAQALPPETWTNRSSSLPADTSLRAGSPLRVEHYGAESSGWKRKRRIGCEAPLTSAQLLSCLCGTRPASQQIIRLVRDLLQGRDLIVHDTHIRDPSVGSGPENQPCTFAHERLLEVRISIEAPVATQDG